MITRIPMVGNYGDSFLKGLNSGGNLMTQILKPRLLREGRRQQGEQFQQSQAGINDRFLQELALRKQAEARMGANSDLQRQILQEKLRSLKPGAKLADIEALINGLSTMKSGKEETQANQMPSYLPSIPEQNEQANNSIIEQNQEIPSINENAISPYNANQQDNSLNGIDMDAIKRGLIYQAAGLKASSSTAMKEPPEAKRAADLRDKLALEKVKFEHRAIEKQEDARLKDEKTKQIEIKKYQDDLPQLQQTMESLNVMEKIAEDPNNEDMFDHWYIGNDAAATLSTNPNTGLWQAHGLGPIIAAEGKMSARGNQLALKNAIKMKPNFEEARLVALAKIKANKQLVQNQIDRAKKITGGSPPSADKVVVINPEGKRFSTTKENAAYLPEGWKHG